MSYFDLAIFIFLALFILVGVIRGFFKTFTGFIFAFVNVLLSLFIAKYLAAALYPTGAGNFFNELFGNAFSGAGDIFNSELVVDSSGMSIMTAAGTIPLADALAQTGLPSFLFSTVSNIISTIAPNGGVTLASAVTPTLTIIVLLAISAVVLLLVFGILFKLLHIWLNKLLKGHINRPVNMVLGGLFGAVKAFLIVMIVLMFVEWILAVPELSAVMDDIDKSFMTKPLIENNFIRDMFNSIFDFSGFFSQTIGGAGA